MLCGGAAIADAYHVGALGFGNANGLRQLYLELATAVAVTVAVVVHRW